jgi:heme-degrading monooxygenase HmoA
MAVCVIAENPKVNAEDYERVMQHLAQSGALPPPGAIFQVTGPADPGWRVISVWRSREDFDRFREERVRPAWDAAGVSPEDMRFTIFEVHSFMAGDLSAATQPA